MSKRLREYVKYTTKELDVYTKIEGSCVRKVNTNLHLALGPFCLTDFKHVLMVHLVRSKVGFYDVHLDGIVLDVKKVKVLGTTGAIRADDARIHVNINADVYIFKPEEGAELTGIVKHIGPRQVGVILYRVFNANLRIEHIVDKDEVQMDQEVKFRIRRYNLQDVFPYIDGELLTAGVRKTVAAMKKVIKLEDNGDSGIEEKDGSHDLDDLLCFIKTEATSENDTSVKKNFNNAEKTTDSSVDLTTTSAKSSRKNYKKCSSLSSSPSAANCEGINIDKDAASAMPKKFKKELLVSPTKNNKSKSSSSNKEH